MLRKETDAVWVDEGAVDRPAIPGRHSLVCCSQTFLSRTPLTWCLSSPNAKKIISPADRELLEQHGAAVVECSWVRVKEVPWNRIGGKCERLCMLLLPYRDNEAMV